MTPLVEQTLQEIAKDASSSVSSEQADSLQPDALFTPETVQEAINSTSESAAGEDGLTHSFFKDNIDTISPILASLFKECTTLGHMTPQMRIALAKATLAFKGGDLEETA